MRSEHEMSTYAHNYRGALTHTHTHARTHKHTHRSDKESGLCSLSWQTALFCSLCDIQTDKKGDMKKLLAF